MNYTAIQPVACKSVDKIVVAVTVVVDFSTLSKFRCSVMRIDFFLSLNFSDVSSVVLFLGSTP